MNFHVTLMDVHLNLVTDDPFGQVGGGYVRLRRPLLTLIIMRTTTNVSSRARGYDILLNGQQTKGRVYPGMDVGDAMAPSLHFMPFYSFGEDNSPFVGLLLQPTGVSKGQFRRRGRFSIYSEAVKAAGYSLWTDIKNHDWLEYESSDEASKYTISVV